ncbi:hypothetical protein EPUL_001256 [Erysiphe pulchra]|uniref:Endonuclease/exonuclease/phosphatase domain-containing protein n=1 Tax=Erysiphe pulchra TaxID=225359 RepID=A0A2S4PYN6_9PEZI|nr:hypothetical protein EPUL_001256 [Erysiphe pulchra]
MKYREDLLSAAEGLFMSGASLEPASNWISVLVPTVPKIIVTIDGQVEVSKSMLMNEVEPVSSKRPALVKLYGTTNPEAPHRTWLALLPEAPRTGFRVFDESGITKIFKKKLPIEFCKRCNGHHKSRNYSHAPSCGYCRSTMHAQDVCKAITKCKNCGGPHRSDSHKCLARPTRFGKQTKEQLNTYRRAGDQEYLAVVRANAAEARATIAENLEGANETPSSSQDIIISVENTNEIPVQTQAGEEMRVGRGGTTHDIALARAYELQIDILLIQEPWWIGRTKSHPFYDRHLPFGGNSVQPRAVTYTRRKAREISATQIFPSSFLTGDYCWVVVNNINFLNVYKEPNNSLAVQPLLKWSPPPLLVAIDDFNSVHWAWQPGAAIFYGQGEEIELWEEENNLSCLIIGNTLDLAWSNVSDCCAWVDREEVLKDAVLAVDKRPNRGKGKSAPWLTPECKVAQLRYRTTLTDPERRIEAKNYRSVVAGAKREYCREKIDGMVSSSDTYKLMHWATPRQSVVPPPLLNNGQLVSNNEERACILRDSLLARFEASYDLSSCLLPGDDHIPWKD